MNADPAQFINRARPGRAVALLQRRPVARETLAAASSGARVFGAGSAGLLRRLLVDGVQQPAASTSVPPDPPVRGMDARGLAGLVYELLDAHDDTAQLAAELECDPDWSGHLIYLRALQRKGRETLAHSGVEAAE